METQITEAQTWGRVRATLNRAKAMHFDGCHKIYLSMDDEQVKKSEGYGYDSHKPDFDTLRRWFDESCSLRLVQAVYTVKGDPNKGYDDLIPQFAFEVDDEGDEA